jgi:hypothetical protein
MGPLSSSYEQDDGEQHYRHYCRPSFQQPPAYLILFVGMFLIMIDIFYTVAPFFIVYMSKYHHFFYHHSYYHHHHPSLSSLSLSLPSSSLSSLSSSPPPSSPLSSPLSSSSLLSLSS